MEMSIIFNYCWIVCIILARSANSAPTQSTGSALHNKSPKQRISENDPLKSVQLEDDETDLKTSTGIINSNNLNPVSTQQLKKLILKNDSYKSNVGNNQSSDGKTILSHIAWLLKPSGFKGFWLLFDKSVMRWDSFGVRIFTSYQTYVFVIVLLHIIQ